LLVAASLLAALAGCRSEGAEPGEEAFVVPEGKADNFFSLSAQEYVVEGVSYVRLEEEYLEADEEARLQRVKELVYYRQIAINWFLLQFLMGPEDSHDNKYESLTKNGSYEDLEITPRQEDPLEYSFRFRQEVGGQFDLLERLPTTAGEDGTHRFELPVGKVPNQDLEKLELDHEWYRSAPWKSFDPTKVDESKVEYVTLAIWPEERSQDGWIDYNALFEDGELTISIHFGWDYHKEYHLLHSKDTYSWLVGHGFESPVESYDDYTRSSGPLTRAIVANGREVKVSVWLFWGKPGTDTDPDTDAGGKLLEDDMVAALAARDVIMFSGHSGPFYGFALANWRKTSMGDIDDSEIPGIDMPADKYQVVLAEGCDTYALGQAFFENPAKADRQHLDVVTTTNFSNASTAGVVRNFILSMIEEKSGRHTPWKYSELLSRLDGNSYWFHSMYGVHGIDDNPQLHPYAVVENLCLECQEDADCGDVGNKCVRLGEEEKVCSAQCISTDGCPEGYQCRDVAFGSWISSRQCVPASLTCRTDPTPPELPVVLINELLADPPSDDGGDANGDGVRSATQDEFVELVSLASQPLEMGGWSLSDSFGTRFVFPQGTQLLPGRALLVFGGGDSAGFRDFQAETGAETFAASSLGLNNTGDTVTLYRADGTVSDVVVFDLEGGKDRSLTRQTDGDPDAAFILHPGESPFSPGTTQNGDLF